MLKQNCRSVAKFVFILLVSPLVFVAYFQANIVNAQTSTTINFQGKIVRNDTGYEGLNVTDGSPACVNSGADTCDFQVKYYSASSGGTLFLTETFLDKEIGAYGGIFDLSLGGGTPTAGSYSTIDAMIKGETSIYVEILFAPGGAGSYTETFSRMPLQASPFAIKSKYSSEAKGAFKFENAANSTGYSGSNGMVYYDTTDSVLKLYTGGSWVDIATGGSSVWGTDSITSYSHSPSQFLETSGIATLSNFGVDATVNRAWVHGASSRTGFSVYSNYGGATDWPLVTFKADASNFGNSILQLIQDGTGSIFEAYRGSNKVFDIDNSGDAHLGSDGILYIEPFASLPLAGALSPASGEGCLYSTGGNLYWDGACNASTPTQLNVSSSLWTDAGTFAYLTATADDLVLGGTTIADGTFFFDVDGGSGSYLEVDSADNLTRLFTIDSSGNVGIGTATPGAKLDIGGSSSTITNSTGDITIIPAESLVIKLPPSGTSNLTEWQDSSGGTMMLVNNYDGLIVGSPSYGQGAIGIYQADEPTLYFRNDNTGYTGTDGSMIYLNSENLHIFNKESTGNIALFTNSIQRVTLLSNGRFGVGVTTPASNFHMRWADSGAGGGMDVGGQLMNDAAVFENSGNIHLQLMPGGSSYSSNIAFSMPTNAAHGAIKYNYTGGGGGAVANGFGFWTNGNVFRMALDANGNLGIGDETPTYKLDVAGNARATHVYARTVGTMGAIGIVTGSDTLPGYLEWRLPAVDGASGTRLGYMGWHATDVMLALENSADFYITGGEVGIGTATPSSTLEVNGNVELTNLYDNDATNFFDGTCSTGEHITAISSNGAFTCTAITGLTASAIANDALDYAQFQDTLGLDASLTLNQATYTWTQNFTGTTSNGITYNGNFLTSGTVMRLNSSSTAGSGFGNSKVLWISRSGANENAGHIAYGIYLTVTNTGTVAINRGIYSNVTASSATNYAVMGLANGTSSTNTAGYFSASGGAANYGLVVAAGNVGILNATPTYPLDVNGDAQIVGDLYGKSANGAYSNMYRWGGLYLTWDSDSYGTNTNHSIRSTYGDTYGDDITINSYGAIRMNIDSDANGTADVFEVGYNTTGTANRIFALRDKDGSGFTLGGYTMTLNTNNCYDSTCGVDGIIINGNGWMKLMTGTMWAGAYSGITGAQDSGIIFSGGSENTGVFVIAPYASGGAVNGLRMLGSNGYVGIGLATPGYRVDLPNTADTGGRGRANQWTIYSDIRLKENIVPIENPLLKVLSLQPVMFNWRSGGTLDSGFIAQWLEPVFPELVSTGTDGIKSVDYSKLTPYLAGAIQEINNEVVNLKASVRLEEETIIRNSGWYSVAEVSELNGADFSILNTSLGSYQNLQLYFDGENIKVNSNFSTGDSGINKIRITMVNGIKRLEVFIPVVSNNRLSIKSNVVTNIVHVEESIATIQTEISLDTMQFGVEDVLLVSGDKLRTSGSIVTSGALSNIGESSSRWNDIYTKGTIRLGSGDSEGGIRYNVQTKRLEFSNDGITWLEMGDLESNMVISPEYSGAILYADGSDNYGRMTSDAIDEGGIFQNYYEWVSDRDTLQDYDILVKVTLPSDFAGWNEDAISLDFMTENSASVSDNRVDLSLIGKNGVDATVTEGISMLPGSWERFSIKSSDISECNKAGYSCTLRISMYSKDSYFVRVGDISLNYNRSL